MCGIFGYSGTPISVDHVVLGALRSMEYRGYDSWGTAFVSTDRHVDVVKGVGRVPASGVIHREAEAAIGHTRWATHGAVNEQNAHPHLSSDGRIAVVHNGIIENALALRRRMPERIRYASDTDSELMAHLVSQELHNVNDLRAAVEQAFASIEGANAFVVLDLTTAEIVAITHRMPIRVGRVNGHVALASDPAVFAGQSESIVALPDCRAISLGQPGLPAESLLRLEHMSERITVPTVTTAERSGPGASMRAEIAEQPDVLQRLLESRDAVDEAVMEVAMARRVVLTGCGSAFHAATFAADRLAYSAVGPDAVAVPASELAGRARILGKDDVVLALSQSGETADVIDALDVAAGRGARTIGAVNVAGSTVSNMVDIVVPLLAGTERSVLATKSFMAMLGRMVQLVEGLSCRRGRFPPEGEAVCSFPKPDALATMLASEGVANWVERMKEALVHRSSALIVGSGTHMSIALEAALKIKEGAYVHAEAVRAGEFKHGVIALIDDAFPCLLIAGDHSEGERQAIVAAELRSRGAAVFEMTRRCETADAVGDDRRLALADSPFSQTIIAQLIALEVALARGIDPDYPRNLAKSVTVR